MIKRKVTTNLMKKLETFKILALGEATSLPILLIGEPGVAKTAAVIDYAKAATATGELDDNEVFLIETDEGTRSSEIKGTMDIEALAVDNKYQKISPITTAKRVIINEVDKASASLRNSMLGVMNEKVLFDGKNKVKCQWESFVATCNKIPEDEIDSPFWDRFLVTFHVERLRQSEILEYYAKGGKSYSQTYNINIPEQTDIDAITLDPIKLKKVIDLVYKKLSDRTLSFLPVLVKNIMCVWNFNEDRGLIKAVELLVGKNEAKTLANNLVSAEMRAIYDAIDMIGSSISMDAYDQNFDKVNRMCEALNSAGKLKQEDIDDITARVNEQEDKLEFLKTDEDAIVDMATNMGA